MRACAIVAIAVWAASSAAASAADVYGGGPAAGYGPYAYSPRIEPLIVWDYQPGVIVRTYWWSPWQNRHYFPRTGKRPKVGRLEHVTARKRSPPQDFYRSWWVSSVFGPELPPPVIQPGAPFIPQSAPVIPPGAPLVQPGAVEPAPSLAPPE